MNRPENPRRATMQRNSKAIGYGQQKMGKGIKTDSRLQIALNADNFWA